MKRPWRWFLVILLAHVAGSYGVELVDMAANYGMNIAVSERLIAPVRALPWLITETAKQPNEALIPFWLAYLLPMSLTLVLFPFISWVLKRRKLALARQSLNLCQQCAYDLRATPNRCPECGTIPAKTQPPNSPV